LTDKSVYYFTDTESVDTTVLVSTATGATTAAVSTATLVLSHPSPSHLVSPVVQEANAITANNKIATFYIILFF
jgi:hypothetical protein